MGKAARSKSKPKPKSAASRAEPLPTARVQPSAERRERNRGLVEVIGGSVLIVVGYLITATTFGAAESSGGKFVVSYGPVLVGLAAIARGAARLSPKTVAAPPRPDVRRWIYGGLALVFALVQAACVIWVIPNRFPSAWLHLWSFPFFMVVLSAGTFLGGRTGWWMAVLAGSAVLASFALIIVRILISAAFLAGVYGAFGKAAATFSFVAIALIVEAVALLPIVQIKWLMSRAGKRAYGV